MSAWRVIITDSESLTGVAPVCETEHFGAHEGSTDPHGIYDCCPHPHIEMWGESDAEMLAGLLTEIDAKACS